MKNRVVLALSFVILFSLPSTLFASGGDNAKTARTIVELWNSGKYEEMISRFDSTMRELAPAPRLRALWTMLIGQNGTFEKILGDTTVYAKGYESVIVTCKFQNSVLGLKVVFDKNSKVTGLFVVPPPAGQNRSVHRDPSSSETVKGAPYILREVSFGNRTAGVTLAGTLTIPDTTGKYPAVLLISGSGPNGRNEMVAGHEIFRVLADYLTRHGIAVLRYDKRGIGGSTGDYRAATTMDFASDALAGVNYLTTLKEVDKKEIGLIGHSEGGEIVPIVADESNNVAFVVMMAGPGVTGEKILLSQEALIAKAEGVPDSTIRLNRQLNESMFKVVLAEKDSSQAAAKLRAILERGFSRLGMYHGHKNQEELSIEGNVAFLLSRWTRFFLTYNPAPALERVKCPVLALWGSKDLQVPPSQNMPPVRKALEEGGNKHFKLMKLQGLNHLFQKAKTGSPLEYATIKEAISPKALDVITNWILKETGHR